MELEQIIPHVTKCGNEYLIKFEKFEVEYLPKEINIPVVDISLVLVNHEKSGDMEILRVLSESMLDYLEQFDVIIYYYSDITDVNIRKSRNITPQEFRHRLFSCLFEKYGNESLILKPFIVTDQEAGNHYISLISHIHNKYRIEAIIDALENLHK